MHIMVVENDPDTREVIQLALVSAGHQVYQSDNVAEALHMLRVDPDIQLVIADMHLGGRLSGQQMVDILQQRRHPGHCILTSGDWDALDHPCPDHVSVLRKPYGCEDLLRAVNHALGQPTAMPLACQTLPTP